MFSLPFTTHSTITINKPIEQVFTHIADFHTWRTWSPWLCQEPECPLDIQGEPGQINHGQTWHGVRIGHGEMHTLVWSRIFRPASTTTTAA